MLKMEKMENLIENKEKAQFLSLVIKKISKDRLSSKELKSYEVLKEKIDPTSILELELVNEWKKAESQSIADRVNEYQKHGSANTLKSPKQYLINITGRILSFFI